MGSVLVVRGWKQAGEGGGESRESVFIANRHVITQVEPQCLSTPALLSFQLLANAS